MREHGCLHYYKYSLHRITFKAITFVNMLCACFIAIYVCSGKIRLCDLQEFTIDP